MKHRLYISVLVSVLAMGALIASCKTPPTVTVEKSTQDVKVAADAPAEPTSVREPEAIQKPVKAAEIKAKSTPQLKVRPTVAIQAPVVASPPAPEVVGSSVELAVAEIPYDLPDYDRGDWKHWIDEDRDCQNARHEVLIHESQIRVQFKDDRKCQVATGEWYDPYTGDTLTDATKLDVDHMVPLKNAHDSGGWAWDKERKADYANYMVYEDHLIVVTASANRKKGARGPDGWKPSNKGYWCDYATDWIDIKVKWDLSATKAEWVALQEMLGTCGQTFSITPVPSKAKKPAPEPTSKPVSTTPIALPKSGSLQKVQIASIDCKGKPETVVISNSGDLQHDMTGWSITDEGVKHTFSFPDGFVLGAGMSVEVVSGAGGDDTKSTIYWKKQNVWNNDGDTATMVDSAGSVVMEMDCP